MAGEVLDVNSLSIFHGSLYILRNGNGYLDLRFFVDFQTIATIGGQIVISAGNITVSIISNILQLIVGSRGTGAFRNRIECKILRNPLIQHGQTGNVSRKIFRQGSGEPPLPKKPPDLPLKLSWQSSPV